MKRVLITGANSYIGTSLEEYLAKWPDSYQVDTLDMVGEAWHDASFEGYDSVFHVAGIAHVSTTRMDASARDSYWRVNALLPIQVAEKAKVGGVRQMIFLSSMSVYGEIGSINRPIVITPNTPPNPRDIYGKSKFHAEGVICAMADKAFHVCVLRPPMVYGKGAKGNYSSLVRLASCVPAFPNIKNQRSMLSIDRLCAFVKRLIDDEASGLFFPQDDNYVCTAEMVATLASKQGRHVHLCRLLNPLIRILGVVPGSIGEKTRKAFGSLTYDKGIG